jgi:hypothetical protein
MHTMLILTLRQLFDIKHQHLGRETAVDSDT